MSNVLNNIRTQLALPDTYVLLTQAAAEIQLLQHKLHASRSEVATEVLDELHALMSAPNAWGCYVCHYTDGEHPGELALDAINGELRKRLDTRYGALQ